MKTSRLILAVLAALVALGVPRTGHAEVPQILAVETSRVGMGWRIDVTLQHPDTGWDHFADGWDVVDEAGNRLGFRELMHPHVNEQPFTRSLINLMLPDGLRRVYIRAHCSEHGWGETRYPVDLDP